jgi:hypothetical protein
MALVVAVPALAIGAIPALARAADLELHSIVMRIAPPVILAHLLRRCRQIGVAAHGKSSQGMYHWFPRWQHRNLELQCVVTGAEASVEVAVLALQLHYLRHCGLLVHRVILSWRRLNWTNPQSAGTTNALHCLGFCD